MSPTARRWLVSAAFGLLAGWWSGGVIFPALSGLMGAPVPPDAPARLLPVLAVALQGAVAVTVTLLLARVADARRRLGWGCLASGGILLLNGIVILLLTGVADWLLGIGPSRAGGNGASAGLFVLMLGLPYALLCVALLAGGAMLLRRPPRHADNP